MPLAAAADADLEQRFAGYPNQKRLYDAKTQQVYLSHACVCSHVQAHTVVRACCQHTLCAPPPSLAA
jgi:hypothetical protein